MVRSMPAISPFLRRATGWLLLLASVAVMPPALERIWRTTPRTQAPLDNPMGGFLLLLAAIASGMLAVRIYRHDPRRDGHLLGPAMLAFGGVLFLFGGVSFIWSPLPLTHRVHVVWMSLGLAAAAFGLAGARRARPVNAGGTAPPIEPS